MNKYRNPKLNVPESNETNSDWDLELNNSSERRRIKELVRHTSTKSIPELDPLPDTLEVPVALKIGDNITTDKILLQKANTPHNKNDITEMCEHVFKEIKPEYAKCAKRTCHNGGHAIIGGINFGHGSHREYAALAARFIGLRVVLAKSFARTHWYNLINYGILPLRFVKPDDYKKMCPGELLQIKDIRKQLTSSDQIKLRNCGRGCFIKMKHGLSKRQAKYVLEDV